MDNYKTYNEMYQFNRNTKFVEKLISCLLALVFTCFFWYYSRNIENNNICYAIKDSREPVPSET